MRVETPAGLVHYWLNNINEGRKEGVLRVVVSDGLIESGGSSRLIVIIY